MDTTDVLSNYFMTVDMHRFDLMWLVYSRNKFFRVGPNISEKFVPGGTNFRGVQIKRDRLSADKRTGSESRHHWCTTQRAEWHSCETLSSGLREALYWPKNGLRSNLIPAKAVVSKFIVSQARPHQMNLVMYRHSS